MGHRYKIEVKGTSDVKYTYCSSPKQVIDVFFSSKGKECERVEDEKNADIKITLLDSRKSITYYRIKKKSEVQKEKKLREYLDSFSYSIDDYGTLMIYTPDKRLLNEIADCQGMSQKKINNLVDEVIMESDYFQSNFKV